MKPIPWYLRLLGYNKNPDKWSASQHRNTNYAWWTAPVAERVDCWKDRTLAVSAGSVDWPRSYWLDRTGQRIYVNLEDTEIDSGYLYTIWQGSMTGAPLQNGTFERRSLTYGWAELGKRFKTTIPKARSGWYWTRGYPSPAWDRHCCIYDPADGSMHEMIQFDPFAPQRQLPWPNQAGGWGKYIEGKLVAGTGATAVDISLSAGTWTIESKDEPHRCNIVVPDYVGADGTLEGGVRAGVGVYLPADCESYQEMVALGGECRAIAWALNVYGAWIMDRNGYEDAKPDPKGGHSLPGVKPLAPNLAIQPGRQWKDTNIDKLKIRLGDFRVMKG